MKKPSKNPLKYLLIAPCLFLMTLPYAALGQASVEDITPPSPEAAAFGKYIDNPISKYNGTVDVSIPIYTVRDNDIELPIRLSYHGGGVKVEEEATWVGLGWTLFSGGVITRSKRGLDDFMNTVDRTGYLHLPLAWTPPQSGDDLTYEYLVESCNAIIDPTPDLFYFNFNGHSGKFLLNKDIFNPQVPGDGVTLLSSGKYLVDYEDTNQGWKITTPDGYIYEFSEIEETETWYPNAGLNPSDKANTTYARIASSQGVTFSEKYISSWHLTSVTSPYGNSVTLHYKSADENEGDYAFRSAPTFSERAETCDIPGIAGGINSSSTCNLFDTSNPNLGDIDSPSWQFLQQDPGYSFSLDISCLPDALSAPTEAYVLTGCGSNILSSSLGITYQKYLDRIEFSNGVIEFKTSDRSDVIDHYDASLGTVYALPQKLDTIKLKYWDETINKEWVFDYDYFGGGADPYNKRLKLLSFQEIGVGEQLNPYTFSYNGTQLPSKISFRRDHWGYANGLGDQFKLIPQLKVYSDQTSTVLSGADREMNEQYAKAAILESITYPTKGTTSFFYEGNDFDVPITTQSSVSPGNFIAVQGDQTAAFEVTGTAQAIDINVNLYCGGASSCFSGQSPPSCTVTTANLSLQYLRIVNLDTQSEVTRLLSDYDCPPSAGLNCSGVAISEINGAFGVCGKQFQMTETLSPGKYLIRVVSANDVEPSVSFSVNTSLAPVVISELSNSTVKGGGLRVSRIEHHDNLRPDRNIVKSYDYTTVNISGQKVSSGKLMTNPRYIYGRLALFGSASSATPSGKAIFYSASYPNVPMGNAAQGNPIGYTRVTESIGEHEEGGSMVSVFENIPDPITDKFVPNAPVVTNAETNGSLLKETYYDIDGNKVREDEYIYGLDRQSMVDVIYYYDNNCTVASLAYSYNVPQEHYKYFPEEYVWKYLSQRVQRMYHPGDNNLYQQTNYDYTYSPHHFQVLSESMKNIDLSSGSTIDDYTTTYAYPYDVPALVPSELGTQNRATTLIEKVTTRNNEEVSGEQFIYGAANGIAYLQETNTLKTGKDPSSNQSWYKTADILSYANGRPKEIIARDGIPYTVIWAYNGNYPVAMVQGMTFAELVALTGDPEDANSGIMEEWDNPTITSFLAPLDASDQRVSFFLYDELKGLISRQAPDGIGQEYDYDGLNRLKEVVLSLPNGNTHTVKEIVYQNAN